MPLPIGHAAIGLTTYSLCSRNHSTLNRWKIFVGLILLSNLPDIDVIIGLIFRGNGSAFHRGPTHSLLFALVVGLLVSNAWRMCSHVPKFNFVSSFLSILSHVLTDAMFTGSRVSFFWPFTVNWSEGYLGWSDVVDSILFGNSLNLKIVMGCGLLVFLCHKLRGLHKFGKKAKAKIIEKGY